MVINATRIAFLRFTGPALATPDLRLTALSFFVTLNPVSMDDYTFVLPPRTGQIVLLACCESS